MGGFQNGNIDMLILKTLDAKDRYGYEIIQEMDRISDSFFSLKAGTLYPILHNLEKSGYVVSYEHLTDANSVRKYYSITADGRAFLNDKIETWKKYSSIVNGMLEI